MKSLGCLSDCDCYLDAGDVHSELSALWDLPESRARRKARFDAWLEVQAELAAWRQRDEVEWRDRLNAQRDPVKASTPINVDEVE